MKTDRLIPSGTYLAILEDIVPTDQLIKSSVKFPSYKWIWRIVGDTPYCGRFAHGLTPRWLFDISCRDPMNRLTCWLEAMRGKPLEPDVIKKHQQLDNPVPVDILLKKYKDITKVFKIKITHKKHKKGDKLTDYRVSSIVGVNI